MDVDITKSLEQLETRKQEINNETDLHDECNSLIELDRRVGILLNEIQSLHADVEQRHEFIEQNLDEMAPSNAILQRSSDALDLLIELTKLNRICRRIDTNPNLLKSRVDGQLIMKLSSCGPSADDASQQEVALDENDRLVQAVVKQIVEDFEFTYRPLEAILSKRLDLPYIAYATKVRNLKETMAKVGILL